MRYGYVITRALGIDAVPETEQQVAIAELNEMGLDVEVSADRKQVSTNWRPGASRPDAQTAPEMAKRMMPLIQSLSGTRQRVEVLAVSPDFASDAERYMPR